MYVRFLARPTTNLALFGIAGGGRNHFEITVPKRDEGDRQAGPLTIHDFAVGSDLYLLATASDGSSRILRFRDEGKFESSVRLDTDLHLSKFVPLPGGNYLVSGVRKRSGWEEGASFESALLMIDGAGREVKTIDLPSTPGISVQETINNSGRSLMESGGSMAYLLLAGERPVVYAISGTGEVAATFRIETPGEGFQPAGLKIGPSQFLVEFTRGAEQGSGRFLYWTYDLLTGEKLQEFESDDNVGGAFACYDWNGHFTFIASKGAERAIVRASVR